MIMMRRYFLIFLFTASIAFGNSLSVVSYNILNDCFIDKEQYCYATEEVLCPENRRVKIINRLIELNADIVCLQEVHPDIFDYLSKNLTNYQGIYLNRNGEDFDGIATFFHNDTITSIECMKGFTLYKVPQPVLYTKCKVKDGQYLTVINTKVKRSPHVTMYDPTWVHMYYLANTVPGYRAVLAGDFNLTPDHFLIQDLLKKGLRDSHQGISCPTCFAENEIKKVDYLFVSGDLKVTPLSLGSLSLSNPIPNEDEPSDHLPVGCIINIPCF